jgi:hypothetical protein
MDETKKAWDEVGEGFGKLGRMISERYQSLAASQPATPDEGAAKDSIRRATEELDRAFTTLGDTLRDDEAREHLRATGRKLGDALKLTFTEVSDQVRRSLGSHQSPGSDEPPASQPPAPSGRA